MSQHINFDTIFLMGQPCLTMMQILWENGGYFFQKGATGNAGLGWIRGWDMLGGTLGRTQQLVVTAKNSPHQNGNMYNF